MGDEVFAFVTKARFKVEHRERMQIRNPVITIALLLALCACSASYVKLNPKLDKKSVYDPLPLTIGFYKNPDFANRVETRALVYNQYSSYVFPLGKATLELFEQILATMFTKVVPIQERDLKHISSSQSFAGIIEIDIKQFDAKFTSNYSFSFSITYNISILDSNGTQIAIWPVTGNFDRAPCPRRLLCSKSEMAEFVILNAMAKFMVDFHNKPEITRWLIVHGVKEGGAK